MTTLFPQSGVLQVQSVDCSQVWLVLAEASLVQLSLLDRLEQKPGPTVCLEDWVENPWTLRSERSLLHFPIGLRKSLGAEPDSSGIREDVELPQIKEEEKEREQQLPIKKEEDELPFGKEEEHITRLTGEPLKSEDGPSEASRGAEPPSGESRSSSTEGLQADLYIAPSDRDGATSHSTYKDDGHKTSHSDDKLCKCSQSGKTFATKQNSRRHMRIHTGEKPFVCSVGGQRFSRKSNFKRHTCTHIGEKLFSFSVCGKSFGQVGNLTKHTRIHTGDTHFSCSVCGQGFARKDRIKHVCVGHTFTHVAKLHDASFTLWCRQVV
ncbi:zinc finger protein 773-like [Corythoichthys intestinalis]|uniref:zinc finger protein 773-like n=1 Tax=Corythoichthys intestinalis TaxID=161448 RepID=UPI0025A54951|nr:zinc finger protein 773-like [Corythoichthys intestinalis]